jgi:CheY-like chemotaxis protein
MPTLLLVEDDSANYELLSDHLASCDFDVFGASDGREALQIAMRVHPEVVITDYDLPSLNGCELARALRRDRATAHARIILLTGYVNGRVQDLAREAGCDGFLRKPVHLDDLVCEVHRVLSLRQHILVVEDDGDVREAMSDALTEQGYVIATAANGLEALRWLRQNAAPDAILLDLMMPVMDGWQFLAEQRRDPVLGGIPVIIVTAFKDAAGRLDQATLLQKPVTLTRLLGALDAAGHR